MRKKISEANRFPQFDLYTEYQKIEYLISKKQIIGVYDDFGRRTIPRFTLEQYVDNLYFNDWNLRGTFFSVLEMRIGLGIDEKMLSAKPINENIVLDFIQYAANINMRVATTIDLCTVAFIVDKNYLMVLIDNMKALLEKLNAHFSFDNATDEVFISYNDDLGSVVANDYPEIEDRIVEYKRIDNRGDLQKKGEILCTFFKKLESIERKFKGTTYEKMCSDTTFLFNKTGARHWVEEDKIASKTFLAMSSAQLEEWYDRTYQMFLSCMVVSQYLDIKKEIEEIKRTE